MQNLYICVGSIGEFLFLFLITLFQTRNWSFSIKSLFKTEFFYECTGVYVRDCECLFIVCGQIDHSVYSVFSIFFRTEKLSCLLEDL